MATSGWLPRGRIRPCGDVVTAEHEARAKAIPDARGRVARDTRRPIQVRPTTIASLATYVPPRVLTNADLERIVDTNDEWIVQRTGIRERHIVEPGVAASDLGREAAVQADAQRGATPGRRGLIVGCTCTPEPVFPR